jgi:hypothetical protein
MCLPDSPRITGYAEAIVTSELGDWISFPIADNMLGMQPTTSANSAFPVKVTAVRVPSGVTRPVDREASR